MYHKYLFMLINIHTIIVNSHLLSQCKNKIYLTKPLLDILIVTIHSYYKESFKEQFPT